MLKNCLKKKLEEYLENYDFASAEMLVMDVVFDLLYEIEVEFNEMLCFLYYCSIIEQ